MGISTHATLEKVSTFALVYAAPLIRFPPAVALTLKRKMGKIRSLC